MSYAKEIKSWKKVFESDLVYITAEIEELLEVPAVICLTGTLGAGKTTLCKKLTKKDELQSTSYSLVASSGAYVYADFYRLEEENELDELELELYFEDKKYFLCEWGSDYIRQLQRLFGDEVNYFEIKIDINGDDASGSRNYKLSKFED